MTGTPTGQWATIASLVTRISPWHRATSVEVPPISKDRMLEKPASRAISQAPTTPPAGPLSIVRTGSRAAIRAETAPPLDCMIRSLAFPEAERSLSFETSEVAAHHRREIRVYDRGRGSFVLSILGQNAMAETDRNLEGSKRAPDGFFVSWIRVREQEADSQRVDPGAPKLIRQRTKFGHPERDEYSAVVKNTLRDAHSKPRRYQRFRAGGEEAIDLGPVLAADLQHVLESARRDQRGASSFALEQGVGGYRGSMDDLTRLGSPEVPGVPRVRLGPDRPVVREA